MCNLYYNYCEIYCMCHKSSKITHLWENELHVHWKRKETPFITNNSLFKTAQKSIFKWSFVRYSCETEFDESVCVFQHEAQSLPHNDIFVKAVQSSERFMSKKFLGVRVTGKEFFSVRDEGRSCTCFGEYSLIHMLAVTYM